VNSFGFWWRTLVAATVAVAGFGLTMVLFPHFVHRTFAKVTGAEVDARSLPYVVFVLGVSGAVMVGWSVALFGIVIGPFRRRELHAWWLLGSSLTVWFVLDTSFSLLVGFWQNAVLNLVFFLSIAVPLLATRRAMSTPSRI
jgi:hypothetical protein